jgi:hypothetical protein
MLAAAPSWVTSPLTLNIVTALGTLLAGIGAILVLLAAGPRYRLRYGPLKSRPDGEKWKANIYLASRGRRDITRKAFDEDRPIELDIGVRILDADCSWNSQSFTRAVAFRPDGTLLLVGPDLIGRRQDLCFTVTTDEKPERVACQASLIDVSIRRQRLTPFTRYALALAAAMLYALVTGYLVGTFATSVGGSTEIWLTIGIVFANTAILTPLITTRFRFPSHSSAGNTPQTHS